MIQSTISRPVDGFELYCIELVVLESMMHTRGRIVEDLMEALDTPCHPAHLNAQLREYENYSYYDTNNSHY